MSDSEKNSGRLSSAMPSLSEYVTFKWLMGAAVGLCLGGALVTASAGMYLNERFEKKAAKADLVEMRRLYNDDLKWIKQCLVQKCWEKPPERP